MSSAQLGITMAPAIRAGLIHGLSVTGANLEESLFRLVAHDHYKDFPDYRYFRKEDDTRILEQRMRRVTDTSIPEDEAFRAVEKIIVPMWKEASRKGDAPFLARVLLRRDPGPQAPAFPGRPGTVLAAGGREGEPAHRRAGPRGFHLRQHLRLLREDGRVRSPHREVGHRVHGRVLRPVQGLSKGRGVGFFQIGGGIAGDFPICVVPSIKYDLQKPVKPWAYFCQISDSTTSYGSYSGATPNEKITWDKLTEKTPMFVIESDATVVAPLMLRALLECRANPAAAGRRIAGA
jgi:deoxyhypusine synthase